MLIGSKPPAYSDFMESLLPLEAALNRSVNPTIYRKQDFLAKLKKGNSFVTRVIEQPKIMIKGVIDDPGKHGKDTRT